jgi:Ca-activated chloride channel homolog
MMNTPSGVLGWMASVWRARRRVATGGLGFGRSLRLCVVWGSCLGLVVSPWTTVWGYAQSGGDSAVVLDADLVPLDIVALDTNTGSLVPDLKAGEIRLFEDGVAREITLFKSASRLSLSRPLAAVFALDVSGSITPEEVRLQRRAASRFVELVRPGSLFAVLTFNHEVRVRQGFTAEAGKIENAFNSIQEAGGSTRIFDALDQAVTMLRKAPESRAGRPLRRIIVVITDGYDSTSTLTPQELIRRAAVAGVTIYSVTIPSYMPTLAGSGVRVPTILDVADIVPATGGIDVLADQKDFTPCFQAIAEELSVGYQMAFYPPDATRTDGKFHQLRVETTRPNTTIRVSRTGYQARTGR